MEPDQQLYEDIRTGKCQVINKPDGTIVIEKIEKKDKKEKENEECTSKSDK